MITKYILYAVCAATQISFFPCVIKKINLEKSQKEAINNFCNLNVNSFLSFEDLYNLMELTLSEDNKISFRKDISENKNVDQIIEILKKYFVIELKLEEKIIDFIRLKLSLQKIYCVLKNEEFKIMLSDKKIIQLNLFDNLNTEMLLANILLSLKKYQTEVENIIGKDSWFKFEKGIKGFIPSIKESTSNRSVKNKKLSSLSFLSFLKEVNTLLKTIIKSNSGDLSYLEILQIVNRLNTFEEKNFSSSKDINPTISSLRNLYKE